MNFALAVLLTVTLSVAGNMSNERSTGCGERIGGFPMTNVVDAYNKLAAVYEQTLRSTSMVSPAEIEQFFNDLAPNSLVLDAGCGPGIESKIGVRMGHRMVGLDISRAMIARYRTLVPEAKALVADLRQTGLPGEQFDAVLAASSLLHLEKEGGITAINELARVSKMGGRLLLGTMVGEGKSEFHSREVLAKAGVDSLFFYHWKREELREAMTQAGFQIESWEEKELVTNRPPFVFVRARRENL